ncbi:MAG TPA: hypothetical protein PLI49_26785 [Leptospiraceae bacterium]|nr:hypothetical protein [Leptospiraceae bacterium]
MSGGSVAIRGFILQTLVGLLDALESKDDWISFELEPNIENEKVDIIWTLSDYRTKVVQVKSSQNQIRLPKIKEWAKELEDSTSADIYELTLLGYFSINVLKHKEIGKVFISTMSIDDNALIEQGCFKLDKYLEKENISVSASLKEFAFRTMSFDLLQNSIHNKALSKDEFGQVILNYIHKLASRNSNEAIGKDTKNEIYKNVHLRILDAFTKLNDFAYHSGKLIEGNPEFTKIQYKEILKKQNKTIEEIDEIVKEWDIDYLNRINTINKDLWLAKYSKVKLTLDETFSYIYENEIQLTEALMLIINDIHKSMKEYLNKEYMNNKYPDQLTSTYDQMSSINDKITKLINEMRKDLG